MGGEFLPILILLVVAALLCAVMVVGSWLLGPKKVTPYKASPYECGVAPMGSAQERFPVKFYLVAIIFVLFDIEVIFLWSLMSVFKDAPLDFKIFSGIALGIYMVLWLIGDAYVLRVGAIDWDEDTTLAPEKMQDTPLPTVGQVGSRVGGEA
jgi:NADH-quinone oxidoreductase subunit A